MYRKAFAVVLGLALVGCGGVADEAGPASLTDGEDAPLETGARPQLGLMTSLPIYWPLDAQFGDLASGNADLPWQRSAIERRYEIVPLDTLSPIPGLSAQAPETDPLAGLERLAVIQPRGLSPADNVALDEWVRAGGRLLLVLDPMLTGHYELALGDPRRPTDTALIPPVVERWGLAVRFSEDQPEDGRPLYAPGTIPFRGFEYGDIRYLGDAAERCESDTERMQIVRCKVGDGGVTLMADASLFEHLASAEFSDGDGGNVLEAFLSYPFEDASWENHGK